METAATFLILLTVYFMGCLAIVQQAIKPIKRLVRSQPSSEKLHWESNYSKILLLSFLLSLITSTVAVMIFP